MKSSQAQKQYTDHLIIKLNQAQIDAVNHFDSPLLVLAGAGSGKTRVITTKIAKILENQLAMPSQILAVTFTNKAANEMVERVHNLTNIEAKYLNVGTFHRIALKILRRYADTLGYTKNFTILDTSDQKKIITDTLKLLEINDDVNVQTVISLISKIKEKFIKPHELNDTLHTFPDSYTRIEIVKIYESYQKELKRLDAMDFDDLLFNSVDLLTHNTEIRNSYQTLFKYILIDEYQDINGLQQKWIKLIAGNNPNITCVGDDDQSIYGWRGSDISYILGFNKENSNSKTIKLEQNYRSSKDILNIASKLISNNTDRHGKTLWTNTQETHKVNIDIHIDSKSEAKHIVEKIQEFHHRYDYKDFAILVRTIRQTRLIEEAMVFTGIPYKIIGGLRFYERKEIKDILAYIKVLVSSEDDIATERIIRTPKQGIGSITINKLYEYARNNNTNLLTTIFNLNRSTSTIQQNSLFQKKDINQQNSNINHLITNNNTSNTNNTNSTIANINNNIQIQQNTLDTLEIDSIGLSSSAKTKLSLLGERIKNWRKHNTTQHISTTIKTILEEIQYEEHLKTDDETSFDQRIENINELLLTLESFETASEFLDYVFLATSMENNTEESNAVNVMTMHISKGLEFPFIFLPGWNQGLIPSERTIEESGNTGIEEERRLAYVAITRAQERLCISSTKNAIIRQDFSISAEKSMFLDEIINLAKDSITITEAPSIYNHNPSFTEKAFFTNSSSYGQKRGKESSAVIHQKSNNSFFIGNIVSHKKFGVGTITKVNGSLVTVKFSTADEKTIREDFLTRKYI